MIVENFKETFQEMNAENVGIIQKIYDEKITFEDPFHRVIGYENLETYFKRLYINVESINFEFHEEVANHDAVFLTWTMRLVHPKLNGGKEISVNGASHLKIRGDKIVYHKDYFDGGAMLYEQVPIIGGLVRWIKKNL